MPKQEKSTTIVTKDIITKLPFSSGVILPISVEDSIPPQLTAEDWSPPSIIVSYPLILSLTDLFQSVTAVTDSKQL